MKHIKIMLILVASLFVGSQKLVAMDIFKSIENGNLDEVKKIVEDNKSKLKSKDDYGRTPIFYAAEYGKYNILDYLIKKGAKVNKADREKSTPLHYAARRMEDNVKLVALLVNKGAKVNVLDNSKCSPLHYAAVNVNNNIVKFLVDKGAKLNIPDNQGFTPFHYAVEKLNGKIIQFLIKNGADIEKKVEKYEKTPLCLASGAGKVS